MDDLEITKTIAQLRRAMPRNQTVLAICDELERRLLNVVETKRLWGHSDMIEVLTAPTAKFDRKAYMRDYMKKRRKAKP